MHQLMLEHHVNLKPGWRTSKENIPESCLMGAVQIDFLLLRETNSKTTPYVSAQHASTVLYLIILFSIYRKN